MTPLEANRRALTLVFLTQFFILEKCCVEFLSPVLVSVTLLGDPLRELQTTQASDRVTEPFIINKGPKLCSSYITQIGAAEME